MHHRLFMTAGKKTRLHSFAIGGKKKMHRHLSMTKGRGCVAAYSQLGRAVQHRRFS